MRDASVKERPETLYLEDHIPGSVYTFGPTTVFLTWLILVPRVWTNYGF